MRKCIFLGYVLMAGLMLGAMACGGSEAVPTPTKSAPQVTPAETTGGTTTIGEIVNVVQTEEPYAFVPDTFNFELNKTYTLHFPEPKEFHTFTVQDLTIEEASIVDIFINAGETVQQTITPTNVGTFKLTCIPHEGLGMVGQVIVQ